MTGSRRQEAFTEGGWSAVSTKSGYQPILASHARAQCREFFIPSASPELRWSEGAGYTAVAWRHQEATLSQRDRIKKDMGGPSRSGSQVKAPLLTLLLSPVPARPEHQSSWDFSSEKINTFAFHIIPLPGKPSKGASFVSLMLSQAIQLGSSGTDWGALDVSILLGSSLCLQVRL